MSAKEIKTLLKTAKECIDRQDFETGCLICQKALEIDKSNYLALVLYGACLQETKNSSDALNVFKKAVSLHPGLPLAWKGLCNFYEKQNKESDRSALLNAYEHLFKIEDNIIKAEELSRKMGILLSLVDMDTLVATWGRVSGCIDEKKQLCRKVFLSVFGEMDSDISIQCLPIVEDIINNKQEDYSKVYIVNTYKKYFKLLFKLNKLQDLLIKSRELYDNYQDVIAGPEWFCKAYLEAKFGTDNYDSNIPDPSEMYMVLLSKVPNSYLGYTCKGVDELACQEYVAACESLFEAVQLQPSYGIAWYLLTQGQVWLQRFTDAEYSARQALKFWKLTDRNVQCINNCKYWLAKALSAQNDQLKLLESVRLADEFIYDAPNKTDFLNILLQSCVQLKDVDNFSKYMNKMKDEGIDASNTSYWEAMWCKSNGDAAGYERHLIAATIAGTINYQVFLQLGKIHYEKKDFKSSLKHILRSTKLNEWCSENYCYLGHIYRQNGDLEKARRCYQKAFTLCPSDIEAGVGLSDIYRVLGMEEENMKLLSVATAIRGARWAWLKMGLHFLAVHNPVDAVNSLRVAVRLDPQDRDGWESLGDAYLALGSYTAAAKSYQKVLDLDGRSLYALLQIAMCQHLQGEHEQAVLEFRKVLSLQPDFFPALKAHAVSCLALMRTRFKTHLLGLAADACQEAVISLCKTLEVRKDFVCIWKLLGDACLSMAQMPNKYCTLNLANVDCVEAVAGSVALDNVGCLNAAVNFYCRAIAISPDIPDLWYDCALSYYRLSQLVDLSSEKTTSLNFALAAVKKSLSIQDCSWKSWNLLGLISMEPETRNYAIAQHAFLKAIASDNINAVPWCNIGILYLILGDLQLANQSFTEAQRCDPDYVQCWVGQAILAKQTGHHEAMDLYRHSTQLNFHPEGALGYSAMVLSKILSVHNANDTDYIFSIKNMNAVVTSCDAATWFTERNPEDVYGWNLLGLLSERQGLNRIAVDAFQTAVQVGDKQNKSIKDKILLNYGRLLVKVDRFDEAIGILSRISKATFDSACLISEAQTKLGLLDEAYETYQSALEWLADTECQKASILISMAAVVYRNQGYSDSKLLLMQACQLQPVPIAGLLACCALGLLHTDLSLAELALHELIPFQDELQEITNIALLKAAKHLIMDDGTSSLRIFRDTIHKHPEEPLLWLHLGIFNLSIHPHGDPKQAHICFDQSLTIDKFTFRFPMVLGYTSLACLLSGDLEVGLRIAKRAVHLFPTMLNNWLIFMAAMLYWAKSKGANSSRDLLSFKSISNRIRRQFDVSDNVKAWLHSCDTQANILIDGLLSS